MTPFVKLAADEPASRKTVARMCYDDSALYFAVRAEDPDMKAVADLLDKSQANPWATDHIELFIDLSHDHNSYYQFVANAKGQRWQARHTTKALFSQPPDSWRCEWTAVGKTDAQGWTLEVAIPYTCFDLRPQIQVGDVLGVNICRDDPRTKDPSAWAFGYGAFHTPQAFGDVTGFAADLKPYRFELQSIAWRQGSVQAAMRNHTGADAHVKAVFTAHLAEGRRQQAEAAITSSAGRDCDAAAAMPLREDGTHQVSLQLVDPKGRVRFASQPTEVRILGQSILDLVGAEFDFYTKETDARVRCFVEASKARCETLTLSCWLEQDGRRLGEPSARRPTPGVNEWPMRIADLAHGAYVLKAALVERGQPLIEKAKTFRKLPPAKHEVRISQWGRYLVCDGEPVFWYGFYDNLSRGDDERWVEALKLMQGANCNAVLNYIGGKAEHEKVGWALDQAHAHGIKMWVHLGWMLSYWIEKYKGRTDRYANDEEALAALRQEVLAHKDHPALLGWCTLDEPGNRPTLFTKEYTEKYYRLIKELDPHHPCMFSHLTRVGESSIYGGATDLALIPFLERGGRYDQLFWEFWDAGLPLATNSPCFGALGSACREPTPSEQRVRMYKSLILGARGLCIYTFRCASVKTWDEIAQVGRELRQLAPVLLTADDRLRVDVTPASEDVFVLLKAFKGKHFLLAVNAGPKPVEAVFRLVDAPIIGKLTPLFATPPPTRIDLAAKTLHVRLSAQSTAIYDIAPVER